MFAEERYMRIIEKVNEKGKITVTELSELLNVTPVTVRRDLEKLEEKRLLIRTHGGAISVGTELMGTRLEKSFSEKEEALVSEKERIAEAAATLVKDNESVMLTPGTTNMMLAKHLMHKPGLTLVTNAVNIALHVCSYSDCEVILLGGHMRRKSLAAVGPIAEDALLRIRVDKLFLGVDGFDLTEGLTTPNLAEANMNRQMISIAREIIVVADHSKFGKVLFSHISSIDEVQTVVADASLDSQYAKSIRDMGIRLILA